MQDDPIFTEMLNFYRNNVSKQYELIGITPTEEDSKSKVVAFLEWHMVVAIIAEVMERIGAPPQRVDDYVKLTSPEITFADEELSKICVQLLSNEEFLSSQIQNAIKDTNEILSMIDLTLFDKEKTDNSLRELFRFGANNPGGIQGKIVE